MNDNHIADERTTFEAWFKTPHGLPLNSSTARVMWEAWQARAALAAPIAPRADADTAGAKCFATLTECPTCKNVIEKCVAAGASERADADPDAVLRAYRQGVEDATAFPYQKTFDAIAAATSISCGTIAISVIKFREVFGLLSGASNERADAEKDAARYRAWLDMRGDYHWEDCTEFEVEEIIDAAILTAKEKKS